MYMSNYMDFLVAAPDTGSFTCVEASVGVCVSRAGRPWEDTYMFLYTSAYVELPTNTCDIAGVFRISTDPFK